MKILQVHNYYQYSGGEDAVLENEFKLLTNRGHTVKQYKRDNKEINSFSFIKRLKNVGETRYSKKTYEEIKSLLKEFQPDVCHVHNTLPLISPSVYFGCNEMNIPVVQTLHNYRLLCSNAYLFRSGKVCEECIGNSLYHSVKYGCYRNSKMQTLVLANIIEHHKKKGTWQNKIDAYIALTQFSKNKFVEGGLPEEKIFIKPNFLYADPGLDYTQQNYFFFAGRLDIQKGIDVLIDAVENAEF